MPAPAQTPGQQEPKAHPRSRGDQTRAWALVVLAVLTTLFAILNVHEVKVHYIVGTGEAPLIIVIVISLLVGILITYIAERRARGRS